MAAPVLYLESGNGLGLLNLLSSVGGLYMAIRGGGHAFWSIALQFRFGARPAASVETPIRWKWADADASQRL